MSEQKPTSKEAQKDKAVILDPVQQVSVGSDRSRAPMTLSGWMGALLEELDDDTSPRA